MMQHVAARNEQAFSTKLRYDSSHRNLISGRSRFVGLGKWVGEPGMWEDTHYCWVVLCKNFLCQLRQSAFYKHRIPLAETDVYGEAPEIKTAFKVRCDACQKEFFYEPVELMRYEQEIPENFSPHPLFRTAVAARPLAAAAHAGARQATSAERRRSARLELKIEILVRGESADKQAFQGRACTISVNAHGALLATSSEISVGQTIYLQVPGGQKELAGKVAQFATDSAGVARLGVEFLHPDPKFWPSQSSLQN